MSHRVFRKPSLAAPAKYLAQASLHVGFPPLKLSPSSHRLMQSLYLRSASEIH